MKKRCHWAKSPLEIGYHDEVWGRPLYDSRALFRMLCLESLQAGLSWSTILLKMEELDRAFDGFDPEKMALYDEKKFLELMDNPGVIRNRLKIKALINNARLYKEHFSGEGSFSDFLWSYQDGPRLNLWEEPGEVPSRSELSERLSRDLKKLGFSFVGPTIVYAFMQATGMVNDHLISCYLRAEGLE